MLYKVRDNKFCKPPTTWAEFQIVCEKLKAAGMTPIAFGAREKWPAQFWFDYLLLRTAGYFNSNPTQILGDKGAAEDVFKGQAAMTLMGNWIIGYYVDGDHKWQSGEDYDYFAFPIVDEGVPS